MAEELASDLDAEIAADRTEMLDDAENLEDGDPSSMTSRTRTDHRVTSGQVCHDVAPFLFGDTAEPQSLREYVEPTLVGVATGNLALSSRPVEPHLLEDTGNCTLSA